MRGGYLTYRKLPSLSQSRNRIISTERFLIYNANGQCSAVLVTAWSSEDGHGFSLSLSIIIDRRWRIERVAFRSNPRIGRIDRACADQMKSPARSVGDFATDRSRKVRAGLVYYYYTAPIARIVRPGYARSSSRNETMIAQRDSPQSTAMGEKRAQ